MRLHRSTRGLFTGLSALALLLTLAAATARAQSTKIYVASFGNDANSGTPAAPKRNFQAAHDAVGANGEIIVLDTAGYGTLTITKSVGLTVPPGVNAFVSTPANASAITVAAASTDIVTLRGLGLVGTSSSGNTQGVGIKATSVGELRVLDCTVRNFARCISVESSNSAHVLIRGCTLFDAYIGLFVSSIPSSLDVDAAIVDCTLEHTSGPAIYASSDGTQVSAIRCLFTHDSTGLYAYNAMAYADNCAFTFNDGAISSGGGHVISRGNNTFFANTDNGTFFSTIQGK